METIEHLNYVKTNYNMSLTRIKEREREKAIRDMFNACESKPDTSDLVLIERSK